MKDCPALALAIPLLNLFGERYIFCDQEQAKLDLEHYRDEMSEAFVAILQAIRYNCEMCDVDKRGTYRNGLAAWR